MRKTLRYRAGKKEDKYWTYKDEGAARRDSEKETRRDRFGVEVATAPTIWCDPSRRRVNSHMIGPFFLVSLIQDPIAMGMSTRSRYRTTSIRF